MSVFTTIGVLCYLTQPAAAAMDARGALQVPGSGSGGASRPPLRREEDGPPGGTPLLFSVQALRGHRPYMEDFYQVTPNGRFAAVYDGHGGAQVSRYLKLRLYQQLVQQLADQRHSSAQHSPHSPPSPLPSSMATPPPPSSPSGASAGVSLAESLSSPYSTSMASFARAEVHPSTDSHAEGLSTAGLSEALSRAFEQVESEVEEVDQWTHQGSTAAVAVVLEEGEREETLRRVSVITANVGDSRVVLSRRGTAVELTEDHKPNCAAEASRIKSLGGEVVWHGFYNKDGTPMEGTGVYRVNGNLAVARAVGDRTEKPYISAEPDVRITRVDPEKDQFLIVATDGLWDVMTSEEAVGYVHSVMADSVGAVREGNDSMGGGSSVSSSAASSSSSSASTPGPLGHIAARERPPQRRIADWTALHPSSDRAMIRAAMANRKRKMARYLCEEAMRRGTTDNTTVIIVWLQ